MREKIPVIKFKINIESIGFEVIPLEQLVNSDLPKDHNPFAPHKLDFFAVLYITNGSVKHTLDFEQHHLVKNQCLVISKGQVHAFDKERKYEGYIVLFTEFFLIRHLSKSIIDKISRLYNYHTFSSKYSVSSESSALLDLVKQEQNNSNVVFKEAILASLTAAWLLKLEQYDNQILPLDTNNNNYNLFAGFVKLVEANYHLNRNANFYASNLSISYKHLNEISKQYTHKTAKEFIDNYVILEAKRYLSSTILSIKEIAFKLGFDESTNFQKYFKKITKQTPVHFREKLAGYTFTT